MDKKTLLKFLIKRWWSSCKLWFNLYRLCYVYG